ncbi:uncharacterized protein PFL1_00398 [Pseudozyma flocculosa PF-1]|uniref:Uncharacterized protein n=1 Tax=Pseudozyma flocculosa TaxID=84751 RepID=A0A5C3ET51_9BASI|nr:uncharacterized protein PFL1_00398 [Pseudozyma flocculosa PF-1]EPQ32201.1 hypothetical protein PFL1_00398 [Pseudozyma flocculosa PF-1]SPO34855.1 uncharacterized protein PSFLO_00326 [Pseudozyma flocculosa]
MPTSDALRAGLFLLLVAAGCLCRSHFRSRCGAEGDDLAWELEEKSTINFQPPRSATDARPPNLLHLTDGAAAADQHGRGRGLTRQSSANRRKQNGSGLHLVEQHLVDKLSASFDDVQSRRARSSNTSSDDAAMDTATTAYTPKRSLGMLDLPSLESLCLDISASASPSALEAHFPAAQLRPY